MKKILPCLSILLLSAGCVHTRYYAPVLMEPTSDADVYRAVYSTGVAVPRSKESKPEFVEISIQAIHPGFLHRSIKKNHWTKRDTANAWKDKDLWVFLEADGLEGSDLFETKVDRKSAFSHVVLNAASFDSLTVDIPIIPLELTKVYRIKAKIYSIDKFLLKKALFDAKDKSLGKWALDAISGLGNSIVNVFAKEAIDHYKTITDQNYSFEQFLLTLDSNLEFSGAFDLVPSDAVPAFAGPKSLALYDYIKSELDSEWQQIPVAGFEYTPTSYANYLPVYRQIKTASANLKDVVDQTTSDRDLKKSFIKILITPKSKGDVKAF